MIKEITINEINLINAVPDAKKEGLTFCNKTTYFGKYDKDKLIGFTGIIFYKNKVIFKNHYILKEYRNKGYFKELLTFSENLVKPNFKIIEATCTPMSINEYLKRGYKIIKKYKIYTKVRYENL